MSISVNAPHKTQVTPMAHINAVTEDLRYRMEDLQCQLKEATQRYEHASQDMADINAALHDLSQALQRLELDKPEQAEPAY